MRIMLFVASTLAILGLNSCKCSSQGSKMPEEVKKNMAKALALQAQTTAELPPLTNVRQDTLDIQYITNEGTIDTRKMRIYVPEDATEPMPVIYVPHYEMTEETLELRNYLSNGWIVASPTCLPANNNGVLVGNSLIFNNAVLYTLRHMKEVDPQRIGIIGGSAGGYMAMMLAGLQMGNCATIANAPIDNIYFNLKYMEAGSKINGPALLKVLFKIGSKLKDGTQEEKGEALLDAMSELPMPILGLVSGSFDENKKNFPGYEDVAKCEALSPVGIASCYNSPFVINHCTSDILVPIDQLTRKYTYEKHGESMPKGFSTRLPKDYPGVLGHSLEDELPAELTRTELFDIKGEKANENRDIAFDAVKPFNINVCDDGPCEGYGSHSTAMGAGVSYDVPFMKEMFSRTLANTEFLTKGKLRLLLERYAGKSLALPAHEGVDDSVYGSLAVYRSEIVEGLARYAANHSLSELSDAMEMTIASDTVLRDTWEEIKRQL